MRRFRPDGPVARRAHCGVSKEWLSPMRSTLCRAIWTETPFGAASFFALGCVAAEGQGPPGIDAPATPSQKRKLPAATRIRTDWTLSKSLYNAALLDALLIKPISMRLITGNQRTALVVFAWAILSAVSQARPNVLFIAVDDLRAELGCYGQDWIHSPNIDRLANQATVFENAFCQVSLCNPSRTSLLTGLYPDTLGVIDLPTHFRQVHPDVVTLPEHFRANGYFTQNIGKIFHNWHHGERDGDPQSWSVAAELHYDTHSNDVVTPKALIAGQENNYASNRLNKRAENYDVPDSAYFDGRIAEKAVAALSSLKESGEPFFLAVGFWKPHLPFNAPKKYWDLYDKQPGIETRLYPEHSNWPEGSPELAKHPGSELMRSFETPLDSEQIALLRKGYYAAISYVDAQVGQLLDALEALQLEDDTVVVLWSDHGFHLGERGLWCKNSCYDLDTRVPLLIRKPSQRVGQRTDSLVELIDLYPTLLELCDLPSVEPIPGQRLQGKSLSPILQNPNVGVRPAALSQIMRPAYSKKTDRVAMGYSLRTADFRYIQWRGWTASMEKPSANNLLAEEIYGVRNDPGEMMNLAGIPEHEKTREGFRKMLEKRLANQPANYR